MKGKRIFYCELAYFFGIVVLAFGTALMEKADFGMSMVVAPAYLIHLKISEYVPSFSFGMSEYIFQAVLKVLIYRSIRPTILYHIPQIIATKNLRYIHIGGFGWGSGI